ncbi:MAG: BPL-N domain-containing protein [Pseudonocardiaceae bacterium]
MTRDADIREVGTRRSRPIAVVYSDASTGPADGDDTGAVSAMLVAAAGWNFDVITAGPNGTMSVPEALARPGVRLYAQPGADGDDDAAYRRQKRDKPAIKHFIREGGRYLGICMGGFLAEPGHFNVFAGRVNEYYSSRGASVTTPESAVIPVIWRGTRRTMYFQDGGYMVPSRKSAGITVLARYTNETIAALVAPYGRGKVGLCGPHPEAPPEWYREANLSYGESTQDLGDDLIDTLMAP